MNRRKAIKLLGLGAAAMATSGVQAAKYSIPLFDADLRSKGQLPINYKAVYAWNNWTKKFEVVDTVPSDTDLIDWIERHEKTITEIGKGPKYVV